MFTIQPTKLYSYLTYRENKLPANCNRSFFASWEDALWEIIKRKGIKRRVVLIPDFFCVDVINNMKAHGLETEFYRLDNNLRPVATDLIEKLAKHKPTIVILFHAVGIKINLLDAFKPLHEPLPPDVLVIEDCVHRVLSPNEIRILHPNHILIDSLRKVVPLMGAQCFTHPSFQLEPAPPSSQTKKYSRRLARLWLRFQFYLHRASFSRSFNDSIRWNSLAEQAMMAGYDLIGDNYEGAAGPGIFSWLSKHLNIDGIRLAKLRQVGVYERSLSKLIQSTSWLRVIPYIQACDLRGYPLVVANRQAEKFLASLRKNGLLVRYELLGCPWSDRQKIMYLPLGPHLSETDIEEVTNIIKLARV